jgi:hypothetical protein
MVYHDETYFVVVDPLRQPLASKSDRRPVGMLQPAFDEQQGMMVVTHMRDNVEGASRLS